MVEITDGDYRAYINNENILIQHTQYEKILSIEKETLNITECDSEVIRNLKKSIMHKPHAILGIIQIENMHFIIFVKSAYFIGKIEEAEIFRVKETEIIPLITFSRLDNISSDIKSQVVGIKNLLTLGFFYSFNYDLTNSLQKQAKLKSMDIFSSANKKFFWNYSLYKKFFALNGNNNSNNSNNVKSLSDNSLTGANNNNSNVKNINNNNNANVNSNKAHKTISNKDMFYFGNANIEDLNTKNFKNVNKPLDSNNCFFNNNNNISNKPLMDSNNLFRSDDINIMESSNNCNNLFGEFNNYPAAKDNTIINNNHNPNKNITINNNYPNINLVNNDLNNLTISQSKHQNINKNNNNFNNLNNNIDDNNETNLINNNSDSNNNNPFNPKVNKIWMVVCIYGYVGISANKLNHNKLDLYLISRRSVYHAGTRYLTRGLDDYGHVANFVETEQIIRCENNLFSFMQFRGSVPIFFEQPGVTAQTQITRSPELTAPAFKKHIEELKEDYNFIYMVNLMNVNKPNEHVITQSFENQIKINEVKNCKYLFWDFQNQCKYDNYENLDTFVGNLESVFKIFKYYHENTVNGQKLKEQTGIIRTNCLDCLDRTNVIQARVAWKVLENQLNFLQIKNISEIFSCGFINANQNKKYPLMESFKDIWSENGDSISFQYAGTASCITSVTKNGKHGFFGLFQHGLVSITRFYQGNFEDSFKQKCIDSLLQKNIKKKKDDPYYDFFNHDSHVSSNSLQNPVNTLKSKQAKSNNLSANNLKNNLTTTINNLNINNNFNNNTIYNTNSDTQNNYFNSTSSFNMQQNNQISSNNSKAYSGSELNVFVGSWNVAGKDFTDNFSLIQWLFPKENMPLPEVYVIGFQEICNLNAKNIMISSNTHKVDNWKSIVTYNLNQLGKYALVKCSDLVGLFVLVFIKEELCEFVKNIETSILRTGLYGTLGNKGSCLIRFNFEDTSFVFCCSHLKAGSSHANSRTSEISEILSKNFALKNYKEMKFKEHDVQFIFGDLNFRVDLDLKNSMEFINSGYIDTLFLYDQLYTKKSLNLKLMELEELPVKFPPTYKYLINTNEYDLKDKRVPSWCDRILFNRSAKVKGLVYDHVDMFRESDHKPIYGLYQVKIKDDDKLIVKVKSTVNNSKNLDLKINVAINSNGNNNNNINNNLISNDLGFVSNVNNLNNNAMQIAPGNNVYNAMNGHFNNQIFNNAVNNQFWNQNGKNSGSSNPDGMINNFQPNSFKNNTNHVNYINNMQMPPNNSNSTNGFNNNVFEGLFTAYKPSPSDNSNGSNSKKLSANNFNFNNNNQITDYTNNKNNNDQNILSANQNINNNAHINNNQNSFDYLNFQVNESSKSNDNIDCNAFQTYRDDNIDCFDNFQKQRKNDKTNLLVSNSKIKEKHLINNIETSNKYPQFDDDFNVNNDINTNFYQNSNNNNLISNTNNIRK